MKAQTLVAVIAATVAVLSLLYNLVGKKDTVMTKLIESMVKNVDQKVDVIREDISRTREDIARVEAKVDQLINKAGS